MAVDAILKAIDAITDREEARKVFNAAAAKFDSLPKSAAGVGTRDVYTPVSLPEVHKRVQSAILKNE